jgi:uncharacterized protein (TIGR04255 family)
MTARPPDLPDFTAPPVAEVSLGVQFNSLERLQAPHLGLVWSEFKSQFPVIEQQPPVEQAFETFAEKGGGIPAPRLPFQLLSGVPVPRVLFINEQRTELLQVQRDHFYHNWRKAGEGDQYPRFEKMISTFEDGLQRLNSLISAEGLGTIVPNQCEVTYINHVPVNAEKSTYQVLEELLGSWLDPPSLGDLGEPEDVRVLLRYVIREEGTPVGRLLVSAEPAWKLNGSYVIQLALTARGKPRSENCSGVVDFLHLGRLHIVRSFNALTTKEMHKVWGKKQ